MADKYGAITFQFDFASNNDWKSYETLCAEISKVGDVSMLINAVEKFDVEKGKIHKTSDTNLLDTLNANTLPMVFMTRFLGPNLK